MTSGGVNEDAEYAEAGSEGAMRSMSGLRLVPRKVA
jgi:hypothetical protein